MMIQGKATLMQVEYNIGIIYFQCIISYRIIHIKKKQYIMKSPVNFLRGENPTVNLFFVSDNFLLVLLERKKVCSFPRGLEQTLHQ